MPWYEALGLMVGLIVTLIFTGMPVAFAFLATNLVGGFVFLRGEIGIIQVVDNATDLVTRFTLAAVPLFVLLGSLFFSTGLARRVFDTLDACIGGVPGRLSYLTVGASTVFSTLTGSTMANTAMLGSLMVPEMMSRGYKRHMAIGPIIGAGGLAMIIPPSTMTVLLGSVAELNIGALLVAGLIPGLILAFFYFVAVFLQVQLDPSGAPAYSMTERSWSRVFKLVGINIIPVAFVIFCVVGLILLGIATPTEAAAFGVAGVILVSIFSRTFTIARLVAALTDTAKITAMAFLIVMGSSTFSQILAISGIGTGIKEIVNGSNWDSTTIVLLMFLIVILLGTIMDNLSIILITVPIFFPIVESIHVNPIWFGIVMLIGLEMSSTTPPFGMLLFVMLGVAPEGTRYGDVVRAALPFLFCDALVVCLLMFFPGLATFLSQMVS